MKNLKLNLPYRVVLDHGIYALKIYFKFFEYEIGQTNRIKPEFGR